MKTPGARLRATCLTVALVSILPLAALASASPGIATQPQSQSVIVGSNAVFTVVASGQTPLSYQWSFDGSPLSNSAHIGGATSATLTVSNITLADSGNYQVIVSNSHGSIDSSNATLTVLVPVAITSQPTNQTTYFGGSASFSASATGTAPLSYQWYLNGAPLSDNGRITGSATAVLAISRAQTADVGNFKVVVTNSFSSATSQSAALNLTNSIHYVNIASSNPVPPYLDWNTAATNIQDAVNVAYAGDQVIVTNGTYTSGSPVATNCVAITNAITLASVSGPAQTVINGGGTNRCVYLDGGAFLAGFTITNGVTTQGGAGVYCISAADSVSNCVLTGNTGQSGGAVYGGTLANCTLAGNSAAVGGGAYSSVLNYCVVTGNSAGAGSGASYSTLSSCTVSSNNSSAGTLYCTLNHCTLQGNRSDSDGGAAEGGTLNYCLLIDNYADAIGGGAYAATLNNCLIIGNSTSYLGGGADACGLFNCTVANNSAASDGGGVQGCTLTNCIVYFNTSVGTGNYGGTNTMSWCCTTPLTGAGAGDGIIGISNISAAPIFVNAAAGNYQLYPGSPGIDAGNNSAVSTAVDLAGNPRIVNGTVAMGAYEFQNSPFFETQPSNQLVAVGTTVTLTTLAVGTPSPAYQWYFNGAPLADNGHYSGSGTATLQISDAQISDTGNYFAIVTNSAGSATTSVATVTVLMPPAITLQPTSQSLLQGSNVTFVATGSGSALSYQWFFNGNALTDGGQISGSATGNLTISDLQSANDGNYMLVVTNPLGSATSAVATLTVLLPPAITSTLANETVDLFGTAIFSVSATGTGSLAYQWQENGTNLTDGGPISGSITPTLTISNVQMNASGNYSVTVSSVYGSASSTATLTVVPLVSWGDDSYGQNTIPAGATNATAIAAGDGFELALKSDGTVIGWGYGGDGETSPPPGLTNAVAISRSLYLGIALESNQTITVWGSPDFNETNVPPGLSNVVAVAGGDVFGLALKSDGTVIAWGDDSYDETNIPAGLNKVVAIAADSRTALALKNDGTVVAWGNNEYGETNVPPGLSNVVAIAGGEEFGLALKSDGTVTSWGDDYSGLTIPLAGLSNVVAVTGGEGFGLALKNDTTLTSWGFNISGESETNIPPGLSNVVSISAGLYNSLALVQSPEVQSPPQIWWQGPTNLIFSTGQAALFKPYFLGSLPMSYQWFFNGAPLAGQTNAWLALNSIQTDQIGDYSFIVSNSYGSVTSAVMVVSESPGILTQPASQFVIVSNTASLFVVAAGPAPLSYQWYFDGSPLADGNGVTGSATANLVLSNVQTNEAGNYQCVVTNNYGSATSAAATLSVYPATTAVIQLPGITAIGGSNVTFTATVTGQAPFSYQWQFNGANIPGATNTSIALTNLLDSQSGAYSIAVSNVTGVLVSSNATLTVVPWVTASIQPSSAIAGLYYAPVDFTLQSAGFQTNAIYQWQLNGTNLNSSWTWTSNTQSSSFVPYMENAGAYDIIATDDFASVTSSVVTLTVIPLAIITQPQPTSQTVPSGSAATFSVFASGEPTVTYQWLFDGAGIPGATNSSLTLTNVTPPQAGDYSVVVANNYTNLVSSYATLGVIPLMITNQPTNQITWPNGFATFRVNVLGQPPFGFDWQCNGIDVPGIWTNVLTLTNVQLSQFGTYDVIISNAWGSVVSTNFTLSLSQVAVWGGIYGESNLTPGLTNLIGIAAGGYPGFDCMALRSNGIGIHWPETNINVRANTNTFAAIAGGTGVNPGGYEPPFVGLLRNGKVVQWLVDDIVEPFENFTNVAAIAPENVTTLLALSTNGTVITPPQPSPPVVITNAVAVAEGEEFYMALKANGTVLAWGVGANPRLTNVPPGLSNVVAIAAGYYNALALQNDGTVVSWGMPPFTNVPPGLSNVVAIAAGEYHDMALLTNGTVVAWGENGYGQTNVPPGLTNVIAIAAGPNFSMALIGNGPPITSFPLSTPAIRTNGFSLSFPSQSGHVYVLQYKNFLTDPVWNTLFQVPGYGGTVILTDPAVTNQQRFYHVQRW